MCGLYFPKTALILTPSYGALWSVTETLLLQRDMVQLLEMFESEMSLQHVSEFSLQQVALFLQVVKPMEGGTFLGKMGWWERVSLEAWPQFLTEHSPISIS